MPHGPDRDPIPQPGRDPKGDAAQAAFWLGLLGIPTFGITAIAGIGVGLLGLGRSRSIPTLAATLWCFMVLATWLGGLVGALEIMNTASSRPTSLIAAGGRLGDALASRIARGVDPEDPVPPDREALVRLIERMPIRYRRHAEGDELLAVEPLNTPEGIFLRWRIGLAVDPGTDTPVTDVRPDRSGLYGYAVDGRQVWSFSRLDGSDRDRLDDRSIEIVDATLPAARLIVAEAAKRGGVLPSPLEVGVLLRESDLGSVPTYRGRPHGLFDLFVPGSRSYATYAVCGGILYPIQP